MLKEAAMVTHSSTTFNVEMSSQYIAISANGIRAILNYQFYNFFPSDISSGCVAVHTFDLQQCSVGSYTGCICRSGHKMQHCYCGILQISLSSSEEREDCKLPSVSTYDDHKLFAHCLIGSGVYFQVGFIFVSSDGFFRHSENKPSRGESFGGSLFCIQV